MKWLAALLLLANAAVWFYARHQPAERLMAPAESDRLPRVADLKLPAEPDTGADDKDPARFCVELGWFESPWEAEKAAASLKGVEGPAAVVEKISQRRSPLHWVLIPPRPPGEARELFQSLQRQGIDSYLVTEGPNRNAISLGLFESREAARQLLEEKKSQNLNAILANFPRNQISYALDFQVSLVPGSGQVAALESEYRRDHQAVTISRCEGVATAEKTP